MKEGCKKYIPFKPVELESRTWPCNKIERAPTWCSVDLRDGNQALIDPMNLPEKLEMFKTLCAIGIKEIEVGFPSASETEYEILRALMMSTDNGCRISAIRCHFQRSHCRITYYVFLWGKKNNNIKRKVYGNRINRKKDF